MRQGARNLVWSVLITGDTSGINVTKRISGKLDGWILQMTRPGTRRVPIECLSESSRVDSQWELGRATGSISSGNMSKVASK